jgi:hypothetical protein
MRRIAGVLMVLAPPTVLAYTADELAAKNVAAKGGLDKLNAIPACSSSTSRIGSNRSKSQSLRRWM